MSCNQNKYITAFNLDTNILHSAKQKSKLTHSEEGKAEERLSEKGGLGMSGF